MHLPLPRLNLVVIRSPDIKRAVHFYQSLGLAFDRHRHGSGPEHFSSEGAGIVFEIYPLAEGQSPTVGTRLGFLVESVDLCVSELSKIGVVVISAPKDSPWGRRAVVRDLDGHSVELVSEVKASTDGHYVAS